MGKATKFFKSLFGLNSPEPPTDLTKQPPPKRRWSFIKSQKDKRHHHHHLSNSSLSRPLETPLHPHHFSDQSAGDDDGGGITGSTNHATVVAAATAAVAEAAFAAAHAAAEVVRMTTRTTSGGGGGVRGEWAAVKIQSYFRAYLARKALRALKALVKLQALVRGHLLRKQAVDDLRRSQALVRVQKRARAGRFQMAESPQPNVKATYTHHHGPPTPEKFEHVLRTRKHNQSSILKNNGSRSYVRFLNGPIDDERNEKILEINNTKPHTMQPRRRNLFQPDQISYSHSQSLTTSGGSTFQPPGLSPNGSCEVNSLNTPFKRSTHEVNEEVSLCTVQNSPPFYFVSAKGNTSMRASPFTPAKSDSSRICLSGYSDHPNYMAYTESSRAKVRSISAPRQRSQFEFPNTTKRHSVYGYGLGMQRGSNLRDSFVSKAYPGSGRLDRLGMPVGGIGFRDSEYSGSIWN